MNPLAHHIFAGDNRQALQSELQRWTKGFALKFGAENIERQEVYAKQNPAEIIAWITARPMFAEKSLLILDGVWTTLPAESQEKILDAWPHFPEDKVILFIEKQKLDKRLSITKKLIKMGLVKEFLEAEKDDATHAYLDYADKLGLKISGTILQKLIKRCDGSAQKVRMELDKLHLFCEARAVQESDLEALSIHDEKDSIFDLTDAISSKNFAHTLTQLQRMQKQNYEAVYLFTMIYKAFENLYCVKKNQTQGLHPFVVKKLNHAVRNFTIESLEKALLALAELDQKLKTGKIPYKSKEEDAYYFAIERIIYRSFK